MIPEFIPSYLSEGTRTALQSEMAKPISQSDVEGYIYCYELRDKTKPDIINLKVGRAVNLVKRIDEWTKSCESKEPVLRGWWPGPDDSHHATSMVKGLVMAGAKGKNCHRLERKWVVLILETEPDRVPLFFRFDSLGAGRSRGPQALPNRRI